MSELYGRQVLFFGTYAVLTAFNAGAAGANSMATLIVLRFFAGTFGSSPLTNAGGVIADMFPSNQRGLGMSIFAAAPFLGPVVGPIVGGFVGETIGWRWNEGVMACFTGVLWIFGTLTIPETYSPVILSRRAAKLSKKTGKVYISVLERRQGKTTPKAAFQKSLARPWALLFLEPIVLLISIYMAIIYGTLYMCFGAFPIVYQQGRGWSAGIGGLAFLGVAVGMLLGVTYSIIDNKRYARIEEEHDGDAPPEARLPPVMVGSVALPIGLFWFAWVRFVKIPLCDDLTLTSFIDKWAFCSLDCQYNRDCTVRLRHGVGLLGLYELSHRRVHHLRSISLGRELGTSISLWCCVSSIHLPDVCKSRYSLGVIDTCIPGSGLYPVPVHLLQVWRADSDEVQVCSAGA